MASSGVQQLGKKSDALGLRGLHRPPRDSQTSNSSTESSNFPPTPLDEITLSLQRYASEQEAVEKKKRLSRGRTTSQDLDVSFDNEDDDALAPRLPQRRSLDRSPSSHQAEPQQRPVSGAEQENTESIIPFPKAAEKKEIPVPAHPLDGKLASPRVINPRHHGRIGPSLGLRRQPSSSLQLNIPSTPPVSAGDRDTASANPDSSYEAGFSSPMIRKKSGEVVKPSLKIRSQSTPHLPIRENVMATKSEPPTPGGDDDGSDRHKNVRFAGSSGHERERLESVVLFLREQKVTAVSKTADGEEGMYPPTETETEADTDVRDYATWRKKRNGLISSASSREDTSNDRFLFGDGSSVVPRTRIDFGSLHTSELAQHNVLLEKVEMPAHGQPLVLRGQVIARNMSFEKWIAVRFTLDDWQ